MSTVDELLADHPGQWSGTLLALFQPGEETGDGAQPCRSTPSTRWCSPP